VKELDSIQEKSKKLMSVQALQSLKQSKNQLLLISLISMHRDSTSFDEDQYAS
jgi:hypothetical protein